MAGGTHSKCSGCGLQRFPSIFSRNLTQLGNAVEWRFSDCYRVFSQKEMKTWMLEFVHFLVMAKGGYFLAVFLLQLQLSKENLPKKIANPQRSISSPTEFLWKYYEGRPGVYWAPAWALKWPIIIMNVAHTVLMEMWLDALILYFSSWPFLFLVDPCGVYIFNVLPCYGPKASKSWIWMGYGWILAMVQRGLVFCCCFGGARTSGYLRIIKS